jgi:predicted protein tyrosine phosphatase
MINKILVQSRRQVETYLKVPTAPVNSNWALISIWNSNELITFLSRGILKKIGCSEVLSIRFADVTKKELDIIKDIPDLKRDYKLFDEQNAHDIINFVDKINLLDIPYLVIHCAAGISRSGAVGLFVCRYLNLDEEEFRSLNSHILPNFYILDVLNKESKLNEQYMQFWETQENLEKRERMFNGSFGRYIKQ